MNKKLINGALAKMFILKGHKDYNLQIDAFIEMLENCKYKEEDILKAIEKLVFIKTPYRIEFADLYNIINNKEDVDITEKVEDQWCNIIEKCRGRRADIDPIAESSFLTITTYEKYGYSTNEYEKSNWHKRWIELYKNRLENNYKPVQINQEVKGLLDDINNKDTAIKELKQT